MAPATVALTATASDPGGSVALYINAGGRGAAAPTTPEAGFIQPVAQFGREGAPLLAVSGPVGSTLSLSTIRMRFGDLVGGSVHGVTGPPSLSGQNVLKVSLVDSLMQPVTLMGPVAGGPIRASSTSRMAAPA